MYVIGNHYDVCRFMCRRSCVAEDNHMSTIMCARQLTNRQKYHIYDVVINTNLYASCNWYASICIADDCYVRSVVNV